MLVLTQHKGQSTHITVEDAAGRPVLDADGNPLEIVVTIVDVNAKRVKVGYSAPKQVAIQRAEVKARERNGAES